MPTLTASTIIQATIEAFKVQFPFLLRSGIDFSGTPLKLNKQITAHIRTLPSLQDYDANNGGYGNGATSGRSLLTDVPIVIDQHKHVPVEYAHLDLIKDQKEAWQGAMADQGFVLGDGMAKSVYGKVRSGTISRKQVETAANTGHETLSAITTQMNKAGAPRYGRVGIVNSDVMESLYNDPRYASKDYYGVLQGEDGLRMIRGASGFAAIWEWPDLPSNNRAGATFTAAADDVITSAAHGYLNGDRVRVSTSAADLPAGLTAATDYYVRDATTNTFKLSLTDGGAVVDISDAGTGVHTVTGYENLSGFFYAPVAVAIAAGIPAGGFDAAKALGITPTMNMTPVTDPTTGFSMAQMMWMQQGTVDVFTSLTSLWGSAVGRQNQAVGELADKAGVRLVTE